MKRTINKIKKNHRNTKKRGGSTNEGITEKRSERKQKSPTKRSRATETEVYTKTKFENPFKRRIKWTWPKDIFSTDSLSLTWLRSGFFIERIIIYSLYSIVLIIHTNTKNFALKWCIISDEELDELHYKIARAPKKTMKEENLKKEFLYLQKYSRLGICPEPYERITGNTIPLIDYIMRSIHLTKNTPTRKKTLEISHKLIKQKFCTDCFTYFYEQYFKKMHLQKMHLQRTLNIGIITMDYIDGFTLGFFMHYAIISMDILTTIFQKLLCIFINGDLNPDCNDGNILITGYTKTVTESEYASDKISFHVNTTVSQDVQLIDFGEVEERKHMKEYIEQRITEDGTLVYANFDTFLRKVFPKISPEDKELIEHWVTTSEVIKFEHLFPNGIIDLATTDFSRLEYLCRMIYHTFDGYGWIGQFRKELGTREFLFGLSNKISKYFPGKTLLPSDDSFVDI